MESGARSRCNRYARTGVQRHPEQRLDRVTCDTTSTFWSLCSLMIRVCARRTRSATLSKLFPSGGAALVLGVGQFACAGGVSGGEPGERVGAFVAEFAPVAFRPHRDEPVALSMDQP